MISTETFIEMLLEKSQKTGIAQSEVYLTRSDSFEATVHEGQIHTYDVSSSQGLGFRGIYQGKMGYASTQALDEDAVDQLIQGVKMNACMIDSEDEETLFEGSESYPELRGLRQELENVSAAEKLQKALNLEKQALHIHPAVDKLSDCGLFTSHGFVRMVNTLGLDVSYEDNACGMYLTAIARKDEDVSTATRYDFEFDFDKMDTGRLADETVREAVSGLNADKVKSGNYPVIFRNDAAADILRTFMGIFSAEAAQKGLSLLKGREGQRIAAPCLTLMDDPLRTDGFASQPFDGEGVSCRKKPVILDGRLDTLLHNRKTAKKQGVLTTANASRGSYGSTVGISASNFYFVPGSISRETLLARMENGLLITEVQGLHAGANAVTGDFSLAAKGYLIENGAVLRSVSGITVGGNFFELMKNTQMLADDLYFGFPSSACVGSPSMWVGELKIAGY